MSLSKTLYGIDCKIELSIDLSHYSTMNLKSSGDLVTVESFEALSEVIKVLNNFTVLGWGANMLLPEKTDIPYLTIKVPNKDSLLQEFRESYILSAGTSIPKLVSTASRFGLKGWEVLTGIPGSLGGSIFGNAGTKFGEIASIVKRVWIYDKSGEERVIEGDDLRFSYRKSHFLNKGDVIFKAELIHHGKDLMVSEKIKAYLKQRSESQPLKEATCGCIFKNHIDNKQTCPAGKYIDIIGLKGFQMGPVQISPLHGNFMINTGGATKTDVESLIRFVQEELLLQTGLKFETEVVL